MCGPQPWWGTTGDRRFGIFRFKEKVFVSGQVPNCSIGCVVHGKHAKEPITAFYLENEKIPGAEIMDHKFEISTHPRLPLKYVCGPQ